MRTMLLSLLTLLSTLGHAEDNRRILQSLMACNALLVDKPFDDATGTVESGFVASKNWVAVADFGASGNVKGYQGLLFFTKNSAYSCPTIKPTRTDNSLFDEMIVTVDRIHAAIAIRSSGEGAYLSNYGENNTFDSIYSDPQWTEQNHCSSLVNPDTMKFLGKAITNRLDKLNDSIKTIWSKDVRYNDSVKDALNVMKKCDALDGYPLRGQYDDVIKKWGPSVGVTVENAVPVR